MAKTVHLLIMYTMLVLTLLLFHKGRKHPRSLMLALYASVEVLTNGLNSLSLSADWTYFYNYPYLHYIYKPLYCLWVPLFYFYTRYCLSKEFRLNKKHAMHFVPFLLFFLFFMAIWIIKGNHYIWANIYIKNSFVYNTALAVDIIVKIQYLIYNFLMIRLLLNVEKEVRAQKSALTIQSIDIRWLRFIVYGYAIGCLNAIVTFIFDRMGSPVAPTINLISISYFFLFFFAIFYNTITHKIVEDEVKPKAVQLPASELQALMHRIEAQVTGKKMFLDPELTLEQIALAVNDKERNISQAINILQHRNVNDYINHLRINHACLLLLADKDKPVFEVMYESGFNTKGTFNLAFKKAVGKTPTQFREGK
ncbi:MAG: helix-turn-helix domain-containing protein [Methylococcaceae bacterium]|nr:AraC family transcriptional regulator [Prolixibacteraceae bacterium]